MPSFNFSEQITRYTPEEPLGTVPTAPGIYLLFDENQRIRRMVTTKNLRARASYYLHERDEVDNLSVARREAASMGWLSTQSRFETQIAHLRLFREFFPHNYQSLYRLPTPYLLCATEEAYPQLVPIRTPRSRALVQIGPYLHRQAVLEEIDFVNTLLSLRRCDYVIVPHHPYERCLYLQMNTCVAPCDECSHADYLDLVDEGLSLLQGRGEGLLARWTEARDAASKGLDFEEAMAWQARIEKVSSWLVARPAFLRPLDEMTLVIPQRTVAGLDLFLVREGVLDGWERLTEPSETVLAERLERWLAAPFEAPPWRAMRDDYSFVSRWLWSRDPNPYFFVDDVAGTSEQLMAFLQEEAEEIAEEGQTDDLPIESDE